MYAAVFPLLTARAIEEPFDYLVPDELAASVRRGSVVAVRLGAQTVLGVVLAPVRDLGPHRPPPAASRAWSTCPPCPRSCSISPPRCATTTSRHWARPSRSSCLPAGALRLRRLLEPTAAGLAALAAGERGAAALERLRRRRAGAPPTADAPAPPWLAGRDAIVCTSPASAPTPRLLAVGEGRAVPARARASGRRSTTRVAAARSTRPRCGRRTGLSARGLAPAAGRRRAAGGRRRARRHDGAAEPAPTLLPEQEAALAQILADDRSRRVGPAARRHRQRQDRGLPARRRGRAALGARRPRAGARDRPDRVRRSARLAARFPGERIAMFHSGLSPGERLAAWREAAGGRARLVLGARSAVFAPIRDLGPDRRRRRARRLVQAGQRPPLRRPHGGRLASARARAPRWCWVRPRRASRPSPARPATPTSRSASTARCRRASRSSTCATRPDCSRPSSRGP